MYSTDLTDSQWEVIQDILNDQRKRKYSLRQILNAIFYLMKTGCQWRMIPKDYPPYQSCYYYFQKWTMDGTWEIINKAIVELYRIKNNREASPSVGIIDSQSVKCSEWGVPEKGFDGKKQIQGRKRHIVVDTLGCILAVAVHSANRHDSKGGLWVLKELFNQQYHRLVKIIADQAYRGTIHDLTATLYGWVIDNLETPRGKKFQVIPQRWKVERNFAWLNWDRRLSKDYECEPTSAQSIIYISNIHRLIRKF